MNDFELSRILYLGLFLILFAPAALLRPGAWKNLAIWALIIAGIALIWSLFH